MSDFVSELRRQLRAAALREEHASAIGRGIAHVRYGLARPVLLPRPPTLAAAALALAALVAAIVVAGSGRDATPKRMRVVATVPLADAVGSIASGFAAAWVADPSRGQVMRVEPRFRQIKARIPVGGEPVVAAGAGAVWALDARAQLGGGRRVRDDIARVSRIDPRTSRVTSRVELRLPGGGSLTALDVEILGGRPWAIGLEGALRIDTDGTRVKQFTHIVGLDASPLSVKGFGHTLWVLTRDERLLRFDLRTEARPGELPVRLPGAVGFLPTPAGPVLVSRDGEVARAEPTHGRLAWRRKPGTGIGAPPVLVGSSVWVHVSDTAGRDRLVEFDLATGRTRSAVQLPEFGASDSGTVGRELWITTLNGKVMVLRRL